MGKKLSKFVQNDYPSGKEDKKPFLASPDDEKDPPFEELDTPTNAGIKSTELEGLSSYGKVLGQKKYSPLLLLSDEKLKIPQKASRNKAKVSKKTFAFLKHSDQDEPQALLEESNDEGDDGFDNSGASENFQEENFSSPERKTSKESFLLSIRSDFSFNENGHEFTGRNFFNKYVPINLISKKNKLPYILHVSKFGNPWRKIEDMTIVRGMGTNDMSKMVCYKRDDDWNFWYLSTTFPTDENDLNKIVESPKLWAVTTHVKGNDEINAMKLLSEPVPRSFKLNRRLERTYQAVFHVTTYNIHLVKCLELMRVQGKKTTYGTEYCDYYTSPTYQVHKFIDQNNGDPTGEFFFKFH